jgi:hypothetical protein
MNQDLTFLLLCGGLETPGPGRIARDLISFPALFMPYAFPGIHRVNIHGDFSAHAFFRDQAI